MATEELRVQRIAAALNGTLRGWLGLALAAGALYLLLVGWLGTRSAIQVAADGRLLRLPTHAATVGAALREAGVELYPEDRVVPPPEAPLRAGLTVQIERAHPATLIADGQERPLRTHAHTLGELLSQAGVKLAPGDQLQLDGLPAGPETPLPSGHSSASARPPQVVLRRATAITLVDGPLTATLHTLATRVADALDENRVLLYLADRVTPGLEEEIRPGMTVTIERSIPVQIQVDGRTFATRTRAASVAGVLGQEGIALVGKDTVEPDLAQALRPGMTVRVTRVSEEVAVEYEPIPFKTVWVADPALEIDRTRLVQAGQPGLTKRRSRLRYEDGQLVSNVLEEVWTEQQPVTKTLAYGTHIVIRTLETPYGPIEYWRKMRVYTTSYTAASSGKPRNHPRYGYTRLGWKLTKGIVAVDPTVIPLKSRLYIPGYGIARAGDTGGGVKGKFVDLGFDAHNYQSWHWWTDVYLLTPVPPASQIRWILPDWPKYPDRGRR